MHDGSRTPMHDAFGDAFGGSSTPMHDGSRTPMHESAWDPNSRTPMHVRPATPDYHQDSFASEWNAIGGGPSALPGSASPFHGVGGSGGGGMYGSFVGGDGFGSNPFANPSADGANFLSGFDSSPFSNATPTGSAASGASGDMHSGFGSSTWTPTTPAA